MENEDPGNKSLSTWNIFTLLKRLPNTAATFSNSWFNTRLVIDFLNWRSRFLREWSLLLGTEPFPKRRSKFLNVQYLVIVMQFLKQRSPFLNFFPRARRVWSGSVRVLLKHETRKHRNKDKITANMNWINVSLSNKNEVEPQTITFFSTQALWFFFNFNFNLFFVCCRCLPLVRVTYDIE